MPLIRMPTTAKNNILSLLILFLLQKDF